ncbi:hypothetical protein [Levilactobacillus cerevisiae]|uniref:hypothetical protein n=1 Tax=Levilactobacillus cerevisiae TaxID=1704076 RepID=UPI000F7A3466|nr:hypothetical protein [Levilactobacillus cerevisiae]
MAANNPRVLGEFTTRKTGNSLSLTVPVGSGISEGQRYLLMMEEDGTLIYKVQDDNPWLNGDYSDIDFRAEMDDVGNYGVERPVGKERQD